VPAEPVISKSLNAEFDTVVVDAPRPRLALPQAEAAE
jgi:hypothetical protein